MYPNQYPWSQQMQDLMNQMNQLNQMQAPQQQLNQQPIQIPSLHGGIDAVNKLTLPPSSSVAILDADSPDVIFYVVMTDTLGVKSIHKYKCEDITDAGKEPQKEYVSKDEYKSLVDKVNSLYDRMNKDKR